MKTIEKLTLKEQQFAQEHHDTVLHFLSHYHLSADDYYDIIIFGYLLAVQDYLRNPELSSKLRFSTVAWKRMYFTLVGNLRYQNRPKRKAVVLSYNEADMDLDMFLPRRANAIEDMLHDQEILADLLRYLTPKEKEVMILKADGYTHREIAEVCHITTRCEQPDCSFPQSDSEATGSSTRRHGTMNDQQLKQAMTIFISSTRKECMIWHLTI